MLPTVVVGDVHGCLDEARALLREAGYGPGVRLAFTGDLVAKGPDSAGVVALAREANACAVLGNHDRHVLSLRATLNASRSAAVPAKRKIHDEVARSLRPEDWAWLSAVPLWRALGPRVDGGADTLLVHGGFVPGVPLDEQDEVFLLNLRSIRFDGKPSKRIEGTPWSALWPGPQEVVFGHDAVRGLQQRPFATGLDTGCVYGGRLTALILPEARLVSVPARRAYVDPDA